MDLGYLQLGVNLLYLHLHFLDVVLATLYFLDGTVVVLHDQVHSIVQLIDDALKRIAKIL